MRCVRTPVTPQRHPEATSLPGPSPCRVQRLSTVPGRKLEFLNAFMRVSCHLNPKGVMTPSLDSSYEHQSGPEHTCHLPASHFALGLPHWHVFSGHLGQGGTSPRATLAQLQGSEHPEAGLCRIPHSARVAPQRTGKDRRGTLAYQIITRDTISQHLGTAFP